jgi:hypothetical protein
VSHPETHNQLSVSRWPAVKQTTVKATGKVTEAGFLLTRGSSLMSGRDASHHTVKAADGWRPPTPYFGYQSEIERVPGEFHVETPTRIYRFPASWPSQVPLTNPSHCVDDNAVAQAKQRALTKFSAKSVDLSVAFAERKETANMVTSFAKEFVRSGRDLRHGRFRAVWNRLKAHGNYREIPDKWLGYRYGLNPVMQDIYGAVEAIEAADKGSYARYRVTTRASTVKVCQTSRDIDWNSAGTESGITVPLTGSEVYRRQTRVKIRYDALLDNVPYRSLASCGVTNPAATLWEILPWSFVVDWFVNVGSFIDGVNALQGYRYRGGSMTTFTSWTYKLQLHGKSYGTRVASGSAYVDASGTKFNRAVLGTPTSSITTGEGLLHLTHMADALSLLPGVGRRVGLR